MSRLTITLACALLPLLSLLAGCPEQTAVDNAAKPAAVADDPHAGHDHAAEEAAPVEDDPHAGHAHAADDAAAIAEEEAAAEDDPHAGHDHAAVEAPPVEDDPHAGHAHAADDAAAIADDAAGMISLTAAQIRELSISSAPAGPGTLGHELELTGEIAINEDAVTHVSPRIGGIIRKVYRQLGDQIQAGAPLLELDSIELADAKTEYLATLSRIELAQATMEREKLLLDKGISAEQDYLAAKQAYDEELIGKRSLEQKLAALGLSDRQIGGLPDDPNSSLTIYTVHAPVGGEIIEKHASLGEMVDSASEVFTIGDLSSVWVKLNVYQQDFLDVTEGMSVVIDAGHGVEPVSGTIDYIEPLIGAETRTAVARVVLKRANQIFRPGLFVTGYIEVGGGEVELIVPRSAVVDLDQDKLVFVRTGLSFEPRMVTIGRQTAASIEVLGGLTAGEEVVVSGAFQLKAELLKGTFDPHAGHAH